LVAFTAGLIYSATTQGELYTTAIHTEEDTQLKALYIEIADKNNIRDKWLNTSYSATTSDKLIEKLKNYYPGIEKEYYSRNDIKDLLSKAKQIEETLNIQLVPGTHYYHADRELRDYYNNDARYMNEFGLVHAATLLKMLNDHTSKTTTEFKELTGQMLRPYLYYKSSSITTCVTTEEEGTKCTTEHIYLITEAVTMQGHFTHSYEWETFTYGNTTVTKEVPLGETLISKEWERLDNWIYDNLQNPQEVIEITRPIMIAAAEGYSKSQEYLEWLFDGKIAAHNISAGLVSPGLMHHFKSAEDIFGIPAWFLMALAFQESSFNPQAYNPQSKAYGLMQLTPNTQKTVVDYLVGNYSHVLPQEFVNQYYAAGDKGETFYKQAVSNPYINILGGCVVLLSKGLQPNNIDWHGNWQEQTLPALAAYGGYIYVPQNLWAKYNIINEKESRSQTKVQAWAKDVYAQKIWNNATRFKIEKGMPFEGEHPITAVFGQRGSLWSLGWHTGVDWAMDTGTPLLSVMNGEVLRIQNQGLEGYGKSLTITNYQYDVIYAHLSRIDVGPGDLVRMGQRVGLSGNTGNSRGPHLHLEIRPHGKSFEHAINPIAWLTTK